MNTKHWVGLWAGLLALGNLCNAAAADAQSYNFRYTDATGTLLSTGTLTTDGNTYDASAFAGAGATGTAVTGLTGSFEGQALAYTPPPHPPQQVSNGFSYGDDLLLNGSGVRFDEGGLVLATTGSLAGSLGRANLLGLSSNEYGPSGEPYLWIFENGRREGYEGYLTLTAATGTTVMSPGGTVAAPTALPSGQVSAISGAIGPQALEQYYTLQWRGGAFATTAAITGAAPTDLFTLSLFGGTGMSFVNESSPLDEANGFIGALNISNLAAGTYEIGLAADVTVDPDFTIRFDSPVGITAAAVPEPSIWEMMIIGFGMAGAFVRYRHKSLKAFVHGMSRRNSVEGCHFAA